MPALVAGILPVMRHGNEGRVSGQGSSNFKPVTAMPTRGCPVPVTHHDLLVTAAFFRLAAIPRKISGRAGGSR
jgi:hypothetical protein